MKQFTPGDQLSFLILIQIRLHNTYIKYNVNLFNFIRLVLMKLNFDNKVTNLK